MTGVVIATGGQTFFGRTAKLVASAGATSHAQKAMFQIGNFLIIVGAVLAAILVATQLYREIVVADDWRWDDLLTILQYVLVLLVASIPVAMPAVFSITMALGALTLSKQKAIVSRLAAIEEMAGVDICTDKTGTLTKNELKLGDPILVAATDPEAVCSPARWRRDSEDQDPIDTCVIEGLKDPNATKATPRSLHPLRPRHQANRSQGQGCPGPRDHRRQGRAQAIVDLTSPPPTSPPRSRRRSTPSPRRATGRSPSPAPRTARRGRSSASCRCSTRPR